MRWPSNVPNKREDVDDGMRSVAHGGMVLFETYMTMGLTRAEALQALLKYQETMILYIMSAVAQGQTPKIDGDEWKDVS